MACTFTISFNTDASTLVATIKNKIFAGNGQFDGDDQVGTFSLHAIGSEIGGSYGINGSEIMITIDRKPFFVSCSMIKDYVTANLTQ